MDATTPPPIAVPAPVVSTMQAPASTDYAPRSSDERDLCAAASKPDYLYIAGSVVVAGLGIYSDGYFKDLSSPGARLVGPGVVGTTWGLMVGAIYPSLPRCSPTWVSTAPPEGGVHSDVPLAIAIAVLAGATAPVTLGVFQGPFRSPHDGDLGAAGTWAVEERSARLIVAGVTGFAGAFIPYALAPRPLRASRKLEKLRASSDGHGAFMIGWGTTF